MTQSRTTRGFSVLLVLGVTLAVGTIVQSYRFDHAIADERSAALTLERELADLDLTIARFGAAQAAYVAEGQGSEFWMARAGELSTVIQDGLARHAAGTSSADARTRYGSAARALSEALAVDSRIRDHLRRRDRLFASDLIFMDALEANRRMAGELTLARQAESASGEARLARLSMFRLGLTTLALAILTAMLLFAGRSGRVRRAKQDAQPAPGAPTLAPPAPQPVPAAGRLSGAADLCAELAQLADVRDLQALLDRAGSVLNAKGLVLWVTDTAGVMLRPAAVSGYSDRVRARLVPLQIDADNVTSLAFRSLHVKTLAAAAADGTGAMAVPLIGPAGCVGVLAAEVHDRRPGDEAIALARIVGAQLSALVAPLDAPARAAEG